jgi:hypothetical protein
LAIDKGVNIISLLLAIAAGAEAKKKNNKKNLTK